MPPIDLSRFTEADLLDLNRRIIDRLRLIRSARHLVALADLAVGMHVDFTTDDGRTLTGTIARLNRRTATVVTPAGSWRVSPSLLRQVPADATSTAADPRVVDLLAHRQRR